MTPEEFRARLDEHFRFAGAINEYAARVDEMTAEYEKAYRAVTWLAERGITFTR